MAGGLSASQSLWGEWLRVAWTGMLRSVCVDDSCGKNEWVWLGLGCWDVCVWMRCVDVWMCVGGEWLGLAWTGMLRSVCVDASCTSCDGAQIGVMYVHRMTPTAGGLPAPVHYPVTRFSSSGSMLRAHVQDHPDRYILFLFSHNISEYISNQQTRRQGLLLPVSDVFNHATH